MSDYLEGCVFCERIQNYDYEQAHGYGGNVVRFEPLNPVTPGHMLFIPAWHAEHPSCEAIRATMESAEYYGGHRGEDFNLITSSGSAASQTIPHLHIHYVPRRAEDGLRLPWA